MSESADVLIVGSGTGALVAALVLKRSGLAPLVIEKSEYIGGTTALSGGAVWFPANPLMREDGESDTVEAGTEYLRGVIGDGGPSTSPARIRAYVDGGVRVIEFLRGVGLPFLRLDFPDYYPEAPYGLGRPGRGLLAPTFDARRLGSAADWVRPRSPLPMGLIVHTLNDLLGLVDVGISWRARGAALRLLARTLVMRAQGVQPLMLGAAHIGQLLEAVLAHGVRVERHAALRSLVTEGDCVVGARIELNGRAMEIRSAHGVILNAGGFAHNPTLRASHGPEPASTEWTATVPSDTGDALRAAIDVGADTSLMDEYYWYPTAIDPAGRPGTAGARAGGMLVEPERHMPHSIIVDSSGARYMNEASDYMRIGRSMYERHRTVDAIPSWLIIDRRHRHRYPFGLSGPGPTPRAWLKSGFMFKARSLDELARACEIDRAGLIRTVGRFNAMAAAGVDEDFARGVSAYDRRYGDPAAPNPCLGPISAPPYYAVRVFPGDVGCAGGLLTDERARVLRAGNRPGTPIDGLYACGTSAASVMGRVYPGGGVSIGQSMAFGFLAAEDIIGREAV